MKTLLALISIALGTFLAVPCSWAWSSPGHMVVAAVAYQGLPDENKTNVTAILQHHPEYAKWKGSYPTNDSSVELALFIFMRASTWADEIRGRPGPFDHPTWHYMNYPLKAPDFPVEPAPTEQENILTGIEKCEKVLAAADSTPDLKAVHLAWLIHLIGDLHQPLHCVSLVNDVYPNGDKGGNDFFVKPAQMGIKLHSLWDGLLGTSVNPRGQFMDALQLRGKFQTRNLPELEMALSPKAWSLEGRAIAIEKVYLRGELQGSNQAQTAPALPKDYTTAAKAIAERRVALAGYRLADEIKKHAR